MSEKPIYKREVKALTANDFQSAISYSDSGAIVGKLAEWRDKKTTGLTLRITSGKAVWYVRRREITLRLGSATDIHLDQARYFAEQTNLAAKRKRNLREFVETLVRLETTSKYKDRLSMGKSRMNSPTTSLLTYRKRIGDTGITWTWKTLTMATITEQHYNKSQRIGLKAEGDGPMGKNPADRLCEREPEVPRSAHGWTGGMRFLPPIRSAEPSEHFPTCEAVKRRG